jgi:uncharacterized protein (DUF1697 family)
MKLKQYLALLRGINVGGNNIIKMVALAASFEKMGFANVKTYIQSGNVIFQTPPTDLPKLTKKIEAALAKDFNYLPSVVVISSDQLKKIIQTAPQGFGQEPEKFRYDVIFLKAPCTPAEALKSVDTKEGVDQVHAGKDALYFWRLTAKATQSALPKIVQKPVYKSMTIRNWNTTTKLLALIEKSN